MPPFALSPTLHDEMRSIGRYLSWEFPDKEIARFRERDQVDFDILITHVEGRIINAGKTVSLTETPFIIYYDAKSYADALDAREKFISLMEIGRSIADDHSRPGHKRRIPLWQWSDGDTSPNEDDVMGYLRVADVNSRVVEQEEEGRYATVLEFRSTSYRHTFDDSDEPVLTNVNLNGGVNPDG